MKRCGSLPLLFAPHSLFKSEQTLKDLGETNVEVTRVDLAKLALWTSLKFTTVVKYQFHILYYFSRANIRI